MARLLRLTPGYLSSARKLGILAGTEVWRDVLRVLRVLESADEQGLPATDDLMVLRPPASASAPHVAVYGRRIAGRNLWIWYQANRSHVELVGATRTPIPP